MFPTRPSGRSPTPSQPPLRAGDTARNPLSVQADASSALQQMPRCNQCILPWRNSSTVIAQFRLTRLLPVFSVPDAAGVGLPFFQYRRHATICHTASDSK